MKPDSSLSILRCGSSSIGLSFLAASVLINLWLSGSLPPKGAHVLCAGQEGRCAHVPTIDTSARVFCTGTVRAFSDGCLAVVIVSLLACLLARFLACLLMAEVLVL